MSHSLSSFLKTINATLLDDRHCQITDTLIEPAENFIAPLTHYGFLTIDGADAAKFLQGQTTCDIQQINGEQGQPGAFCTVKGRMYSSFYGAKSGQQQYLLRMHQSLVEATQSILKKYIVFSKAEQTNTSEQYLAVGLHGQAAQQAIQYCFGQLPSGANETLVIDETVIIQLDEKGLIFECWLPIGQAETLWPKLSQGLKTQSSQSWELLRIRRGLAEVSLATVEAFIPQMLAYHHTGAVSFTKGCYTGQEVVARMHYKGKTKRQLYRIELEATVTAGDHLFIKDSEQSAGTIVNCVQRDDRHTEALAVINTKDAKNNLLTAAAGTKAATLLSLPDALMDTNQ